MSAIDQICVLVAEDDPSVRELLTVGLELEGMKVDAVVDGLEAVVAFDPDVHDAVVADLMMPRGSGMSVMRAVRKRSDVPFILVSAYHDTVHRVVALEEGADDFMGKPFEVRDVASRIVTHIQDRAAKSA